MRIKLSTLYPHIKEKYEQFIKMTTEYIRETDDGQIEIMEDAFITRENVSKMKFTFTQPDDITESLNKKNNRTRQDVSATKKGRIAYSSLTCTYPDGKSTSSKVMLTDCVIQYREGIERDDGSSNYAVDYVTIGVPGYYISKITKDARNNSSMNVSTKDKVKNLEGCFWIDCQLEKLTDNDTYIIYETEGDPEDVTATNGNIRQILKGLGKSLLVDVMVTCSASMSNTSIMEELDLRNGRFTLAMKPTEMFVRDVSDKVGPLLEDTTRRKKEATNKTERFKASSALAQFAMRNLSIA